ncbi:MAG TPA: SAM hydroxide adenosyltransferase [Candidatus Saccharimonadales bacterium]
MPEIIGSIITDCADKNAQARQELAFKRLFDGASPTFIGAESGWETAALEVGGNLVDQLSVLSSFGDPEDLSAVVFAQAANRGSEIKKDHENGTPFCFFRHEGTLVAATLNPCLSLARDQGLVSEVEVVDVRTVVEAMVRSGGLSRGEAEAIANTQFRSLEFLPRLARWLVDGRDIPSTTQKLTHDILPPIHDVVWHVDNFKNGKTNILPEAIGFEDGKRVELACGKLAVCHAHLADVKTDEIALTIGSSGYRDRKWLEVVIGKGCAAEVLGFSVGSPVLKERVA